MRSSKLPNSGLSIFAVIAGQAADYQAINLWQGAPNFAPAPELIRAAAQAMQDGFNQYAPIPGLPALREILAEKTAALYGAHYDADHEITVTAGGSEAIYSAISALVSAGDEVIFFEPAFECYEPAIRLQRATPIALKIRLDTLRIDWNEVAASITPRTRMLIVNTPHNPTGAVFDQHDIDRLIAVTRGTDIVILADEVYEHMVYDGRTHHSMSRYPELAERSVVVLSLGKTYSVTGWRVGYCVAPAELTTEIRKVHQYLVFSASAPLQAALARALTRPASYLDLPAFYQRKRDLLTDAMAGSRLEIVPSQGSFFMLARFRGFYDASDQDFVLDVLRRKQVGVIPLSSFYRDGANTGLVRLSFCKDDATLREGGRRLAEL
ncbi:methionine aminotransferase [Burkholderia singularis]|uniref:Aminotransferase n=1 Tax=Burkholderia singularis TaxID=1503053 RepID=A0A238H1S9_9BURK|nr:methionine aminotransferase [Burkholderia singularis]SMF99195.1 Aspartate aminotransferase [Burkholderia singularis]